MFTILLFILNITGCDKKTEEPQYDIYENHNISACEVNDPLQNIEWLEKYCANIKEKRNIESVYISLYKVIDKEEYSFRIDVPSSIDYAPNKYYSEFYYLNCNGDTIFHWIMVMPPGGTYYDGFMKDKEPVTELFHFVKQ